MEFLSGFEKNKKSGRDPTGATVPSDEPYYFFLLTQVAWISLADAAKAARALVLVGVDGGCGRAMGAPDPMFAGVCS